jgi:hypothetical protein
MVAFALLLMFTVALHLPEIRPLVMRREVHQNVFVVAGHLLLVLFHAALDDYVHVFVCVPFTVDLLASPVLLESSVVEDFPPLF